ncbi:hypothetical protein R1sor_025941 [Riccia sorocarpa]|uniref:Uncharacterized protein n=1 Tax=Riccia sorocarpa TaxID=122646 RepID=A0ABD3GA14_9MARC
MVARRQVAYTIVAVLILGSQSIGIFASRPLLKGSGPFAEKLSETTSDDAEGSAREFQRFLSEQFTKQMTPVVLESKNNEEEQHEHHHDHGRILSYQLPKKPPTTPPPQLREGEHPPPPGVSH